MKKTLLLSAAAILCAATSIKATGVTYSLSSDSRGDLWAKDSEGNTIETTTYTLDNVEVPAVSVASGVTAIVGFEDLEYLTFSYANTSTSEKASVFRMASDRAICNNSGGTFTISGLEANQYVAINLAGKGSTAPSFTISSGATAIVTPTYDGNKTAYDLVVLATGESLTIKETAGGYAMYSYTVYSYDDGYTLYGDGTDSNSNSGSTTDPDDSGSTTVTGTTIYSVTTSSTENSSTELTLADNDDNYSASADGIAVSGGKVSLVLTSGSSAVVGVASNLYGIKVGKSDDAITCTPTGGFVTGDVVSFTGFIKNGSTKYATVKVTEGDATSSSTVGTSFADISSGGAYYVDGNPSTQTYTITADCSYISISRSGGTTMYIQSIVVTRAESTGSSDAISSVATDSEVVSVEYYTLSGAKVAEPVKGINIVRTTYSNGQVVTSKVIK